MLSNREKEILSLAGLSDKQIAHKLNLSPATVKFMFAQMREKFNVQSRTKLLIEAMKTGEIDLNGVE